MAPRRGSGLDLAQDARVWVARLGAGDRAGHRFGEGRGGDLYVLDGEQRVGDETLGGGDAAKLAGPEELEVTGVEDAELMLIEVPLQFARSGCGPANLRQGPAIGRYGEGPHTGTLGGAG